jgi:predicted transposase/invertase (TIGR01784 family)
MEKFINPLYDAGFKCIFGQEESKPVMIDFLNSILETERKIVDIMYIDKEIPRDTSDGKSVTFDIYCQTSTGERIIVEMQRENQEYFKKRSLFYACSAIYRQGKKGEVWNYDIKAVYVVSLLLFREPSLPDRLLSEYTLMEKENMTCLSNFMRLFYLQLPYFTKKREECETNFERWIYILMNLQKLETMPFTKENPVFDKLAILAAYDSLSEADKIAYDREKMRKWDIYSVEQTRKKREQEAIEQLKEAKEKGMQQGMQQGMKEAKLETAANLKKMGVPMDTIIAATGLTQEQVEAL